MSTVHLAPYIGSGSFNLTTKLTLVAKDCQNASMVYDADFKTHLSKSFQGRKCTVL